MYDYLDVPSREVWYRFIFSESPETTSKTPKSESPFPNNVPEKEDAAVGSYFAYGKKWRALLMSLRDSPQRLLMAAHLFICHMWFVAACYLIAPKAGRQDASLAETASEDMPKGKSKVSDDGESLREYLDRIRIPRKYATHHLLPILSSVCSCSHKEMEAFPASDIVGFMKGTAWRKTYVARNGVRQVQSILSRNITDVRLRTRVTNLAVREDGGVLVEHVREDGTAEQSEEAFDRVVLAVPPNVAAKLFDSCRPLLDSLPTRPVVTSILGPASQGLSIIDAKSDASIANSAPTREDAQFMAFRTVFSEDDGETESLHYLPSGAVSRISCHTSTTDGMSNLRTSQFTRTLRTPASRRIVQAVLKDDRKPGQNKLADEKAVDGNMWVNGRDNVWVVGSWCWDGMVLLEGCVVSAMRVAEDFGVAVPWDKQ